MVRLACFLIGLGLMTGGMVAAEEVPLGPTITMAAPGDGVNFEWPVITADHRGLYSRIYDAVFGAAGLKVVQVSVPNARAKAMVASGEADFYPGELKGDSFNGHSFVSPEFAIWYTKGEALLFKKSVIPHWSGVKSLQGKRLLYQRGTSHLSSLDKYRDVLSAELASAADNPTTDGVLRMLMADRADVLIASIELIEAGRKTLGVTLPESVYQVEFLDRVKFYPQFANTPKGKRLAAVFDRGLLALYRQGTLATWFGAAPGVASVENLDPALGNAEPDSGTNP